MLTRRAQAFRSNPSLHRAMACFKLSSSRFLCTCGRFRLATSCQRLALSPSFQRLNLSRTNVAHAVLCLRPPRGGGKSTVFGSIARSVQAAVVLCIATMARARNKACAQAPLAARGTCLSGRAWASITSARLGPSSPLFRRDSSGASGTARCRSCGAHVGCTPRPTATHRLHTLHVSFRWAAIHAATRGSSPCAMYWLIWAVIDAGFC